MIIGIIILLLGCLVIYGSSSTSIKEGLSPEAPKVIPGNMVSYNGKNYRTLFGLDPDLKTSPLSGQQTTMPIGWKVADNNADSIKVITHYNWGGANWLGVGLPPTWNTMPSWFLTAAGIAGAVEIAPPNNHRPKLLALSAGGQRGFTFSQWYCGWREVMLPEGAYTSFPTACADADAAAPTLANGLWSGIPIRDLEAMPTGFILGDILLQQLATGSPTGYCRNNPAENQNAFLAKTTDTSDWGSGESCWSTASGSLQKTPYSSGACVQGGNLADCQAACKAAGLDCGENPDCAGLLPGCYQNHAASNDLSPARNPVDGTSWDQSTCLNTQLLEGGVWCSPSSPPVGGCCQTSPTDETAYCSDYLGGVCSVLTSRSIGCNRGVWQPDKQYMPNGCCCPGGLPCTCTGSPTCAAFISNDTCSAGMSPKDSNTPCPPFSTLPPPSPPPPNQAPPPPSYVKSAKSRCKGASAARGTTAAGVSLADAEVICNEMDSCAYIDHAYGGESRQYSDFYENCNDMVHWNTRDVYKKVASPPPPPPPPPPPGGTCVGAGSSCDPLNDTCCGQCGSNDPPTCQPNRTTTCNSNTCCTPNPTCSSLGNCPPQSNMPNSDFVCAGSNCDGTIGGECCVANPVCSKSLCNSSTQVFTGAAVTCAGATCQNSECCSPRAQCANFSCDPSQYDRVTNYSSKYCTGLTCQEFECCVPDPHCAGPKGADSPFKCPTYYHDKPTFGTIQCGQDTSCNKTLCCDPNPTCSGFTSCPSDEYLRDNAAEIKCMAPTCTVNECCKIDPMCSTFTCKENNFYHTYAHIPAAPSTYCTGGTCTEDLCCVATPTDSLPLVDQYPLYPENYQ